MLRRKPRREKRRRKRNGFILEVTKCYFVQLGKERLRSIDAWLNKATFVTLSHHRAPDVMRTVLSWHQADLVSVSEVFTPSTLSVSFAPI